MKTIKQIADELGVSKDKVKYQVRKLPDNCLVKVGNIIYLTDDGCLKTKEIMQDKNMKDSPGNYPVITRNSLEEENELYIILKAELELKNKQIETLQADLASERVHNREQIEKLTAALVTAQQSAHAAQALHAGTMQKHLISDETVDAEKPKSNGFLSRFFSKKT